MCSLPRPGAFCRPPFFAGDFVSGGSRVPAVSRVEWAHASAVVDAEATATAADDAVPALMAVGGLDAVDPSGRIDFQGLGFCSGAMNLDFAVPNDIPFADLRIDPGIFSMISKAPILTRAGRRTAWRIHLPPLRVLNDMVLSISRYMGGVNGVVLRHILGFLRVSTSGRQSALKTTWTGCLPRQRVRSPVCTATRSSMLPLT